MKLFILIKYCKFHFCLQLQGLAVTELAVLLCLGCSLSSDPHINLASETAVQRLQDTIIHFSMKTFSHEFCFSFIFKSENTGRLQMLRRENRNFQAFL